MREVQDLKWSPVLRPNPFGGMPGNKMPLMKRHSSIATVLAAVVLSASSALAQVVDPNTQEQTRRQRQEDDDNYRRQQEAAGPGQTRRNGNYGAIAWCEKGGGD